MRAIVTKDYLLEIPTAIEVFHRRETIMHFIL